MTSLKAILEVDGNSYAVNYEFDDTTEEWYFHIPLLNLSGGPASSIEEVAIQASATIQYYGAELDVDEGPISRSIEE